MVKSKPWTLSKVSCIIDLLNTYQQLGIIPSTGNPSFITGKVTGICRLAQITARTKIMVI